MRENFEANVEVNPPMFNGAESINDRNEASEEIFSLLSLVYTKFDEYSSQTSIELKNALDKIKHLQNVINTLKSKPCSKCAKLVEVTEFLKKKLKEREDTVSVIGKLLLNRNQDSYVLASQMVNEVITSPANEITNFDSNLISAETEYFKVEETSKTPEKMEELIRVVSPVLKKPRKNKRRFMSISSKKKNKTDNDFRISSYNTSCVEDNNFSELSFPYVANAQINTSKKQENTMVCLPPLISVNGNKNLIEQSPEILNKTVDFQDDHPSLDKEYSDSKKKLKLSPQLMNNDLKQNIFSSTEKYLNLNQKVSSTHNPQETNEQDESTNYCQLFELQSEVNSQPKVLSPLNVNVINNLEVGVKNIEHGKKIEKCEKANQKTVWNLKKSRELKLNTKLKQTLLSTVVREQKLDISTLQEYNGGFIPRSQISKPEVKDAAPVNDKENETFFVPSAWSTKNYCYDENGYKSPSKVIDENIKNDVKLQASKSLSPEKRSPFKSISKQKTPIKELFIPEEDSFNCIPSDSPNYVYKRDAVRRRSERLKLPGQECAKCLNFYEMKKSEMSDTEIKQLLNKCSRHRDKYPIMLNTPPGLWNPVFDDSDEESKLK